MVVDRTTQYSSLVSFLMDGFEVFKATGFECSERNDYTCTASNVSYNTVSNNTEPINRGIRGMIVFRIDEIRIC